MASWLRMDGQLKIGMVHFLMISRLARKNNLRTASVVGKEPLDLVTFLSWRL